MNQPIDIQQAYTYAERMPDVVSDKPKRKAMFLGPEALRNLANTSARRRTEREAMEEALQLLAERDAQLDAMADFVEWAKSEWGEPSPEAHARAAEILDSAQ
jgi:hypothetical protein